MRTESTKDGKDDLDAEIDFKLRRGYPKTHIALSGCILSQSKL